MTQQPWKPWQLKYLRMYYGTFTAQQIAEEIGRSVSSVHSKAHSMGLTKPKKQPDNSQISPNNFDLPKMPPVRRIPRADLPEAVAAYVRQCIDAYRAQITVSRGERGNIQRVYRKNEQGDVLEVIAETPSRGLNEPTPLADPFAAITKLGAKHG